MQLIRKHPGWLALLSVLLCAFAAPYLIPESPDSEVFRSGTLAALLLFTAYFPVRQALERANQRTLVSGLFLGLLFGCALGLGSELNFYGGLLPGMGSLLRRIAVPFMAAPLLGGLAARLLMADMPESKKMRRPIPTWTFAAMILVCWLPILLAYFPGMLNYDFLGEYTQHTTGEYSNLHPLLHSVLMNSVIALGTALHSETFGLLLMSILQMALFALSLAYSCRFARDHGAPLAAQLGLTALYGLHPVFSLMSVSMTKDTLFAACVLVLSLMVWELIEEPRRLSRRSFCARFVLAAIGAALLRNNGVFALALLPMLLAVMRGHRAKTAQLCVASAGAAVLVFAVLSLLYRPTSMPSFQLYSLPAQQLVRAYNVGEMTDEERTELRSWYVEAPDWAQEDVTMQLTPYLADSAKGYLDAEKLQASGDEFLNLWRRIGKKNARVYAEALLLLNIGSWYPDDLTHSTIYRDAQNKDLGYLQTYLYDVEGFALSSLLPQLEQFIERFCVQNRYQRYPLLPILLSTATPLWVLALACTRLIARRQTRFLPVASGVLALFASYLFGPCTLPRYVLPLFCLAPVMLICAFSRNQAASACAPRS